MDVAKILNQLEFYEKTEPEFYKKIITNKIQKIKSSSFSNNELNDILILIENKDEKILNINNIKNQNNIDAIITLIKIILPYNYDWFNSCIQN